MPQQVKNPGSGCLCLLSVWPLLVSCRSLVLCVTLSACFENVLFEIVKLDFFFLNVIERLVEDNVCIFTYVYSQLLSVGSVPTDSTHHRSKILEKTDCVWI